MYKMIALDMDGTTLNPDHIISERNKNAILAAKKNGAIVVLSSGREPKSMIAFAKALEIDGLISCMNGSIVYDVRTGETLLNKTMDGSDVYEIVEHIKSNNISPVLFSGNEIYVETDEDFFTNLMNKFTTHPAEVVGNLEMFLHETGLSTEIHKLGAMQEFDILKVFRKDMNEQMGDRLNILFSLPFNLEIFRRDVTKGSALKFIADYYKVKQEQIIAVGDGENDIGMLLYAGKGIAMGNAMESVYEYADEVTGSNKDDGVAQVIEKYLL